MLKQKLYSGALSVCMAVVLVGCDSGSNGGGIDLNDELVVDDDSVVVVTESVTPAPNTVRYNDSRVQIDYPELWTVETAPNGLVVFVAPEANQYGGMDNCTFTYTFSPTTTLIEFSDDLLAALPLVSEPTSRFTEVNGTPARVFEGQLAVGEFAIPTQGQAFYNQGTAFAILCLGSLDIEFRGILSSMVIL